MNVKSQLCTAVFAVIAGVAASAYAHALEPQESVMDIVKNAQYCYYTIDNGVCHGGDGTCENQGPLYYSDSTHVFSGWHNGMWFSADKNLGAMEISDSQTKSSMTSAYIVNGAHYIGVRLDFSDGMTSASLFCYHMGMNQE